MEKYKRILHVTIPSNLSIDEVREKARQGLKREFDSVNIKFDPTESAMRLEEKFRGSAYLISMYLSNIQDLINEHYPELTGIVHIPLRNISENMKALIPILQKPDAMRDMVQKIASEKTGDMKKDAVKASFVLGENGVTMMHSMSDDELKKLPEDVVHLFCHMVADSKNIELGCPMSHEEHLEWLIKNIRTDAKDLH
jgi:hypothetical protein